MARKTKAALPDQPQSVRYLFYILTSCVLFALLSVTALATQLALRPLFGSTPTSQHHSWVLFVTCLLSVPIWSVSSRAAFIGLATWLGCAPYATYVLGVWSTHHWRDPTLDSALVQAVVLLPVVSVSVALIREWNSRVVRFLPGPLTLHIGAALSAYYFVESLEIWLQRSVPLGGIVNSSNMFVAVAAVFMLLATLTPSPPPSLPEDKGKGKGKAQSSAPSSPNLYIRTLPLLLPVLAAAFALSQPPAASYTLPYTQTTPTPANASDASRPTSVRLLARAHGSTGLVVVGEHVEEEFRFLRVDHSLLGGRWFGDKVAPDARDGLGDSIYSTFVLQEAVRLVQRKKHKNERALFIGLGVGVAAEAFIAHGINTSAVEIDPVVYTYARDFFGLPEPAHIYLEDARGWVHQHRGDKFDYVVHDCFSGGGVPQHLFTLEFWAALQDIVAPDGIVAVNFAGKMGSDAARAIFLTLRQSFGTCRAFHDQIEPKLDPEYSFFNIVFFCSPKGTPPPRFRETEEADFLVSHLRLHVLSGLREREMNMSTILGDVEYVNGTKTVEGEERWVLRDDANSLGEWQRESAVEHWEVMREVLPDIFWETY